MTQKKSYSRYFIILQEDEKGYAVASDKLPSGYAKLEMKNDKCKVSYYVQNLKKEKAPYHMMLICSKKDINKVIKVGELNIDDNGRAEIVYEYPLSNIAGTGIDMDKIAGAAIVRLIDSNLISVMSGFAGAEVQDWKDYKMVAGANEEKVENEPIVENKSIFDKYEEKIEEVKAVKENEVKEIKKENEVKQEVKEIKKENENKAEVKEIKKENENKAEVKEIKKENEIKQEVKEIKKENEVKQEVEAIKKENEVKEEVKEVKKDNELKSEVKEIKEEVKKCQNREVDDEDKDRDINSEDTEIENLDEETEYEDSEENDEARIYRHKKDKKHKDDYPKGPMGDFFKDIAKEFEEVEGFCDEIKRCKWFKVKVKGMQALMDATNYNRYTVVYYPMSSYYSYIQRHGHFMLGYKCDIDGNVKYLVYAVPGTKQKCDQPYGGKSGFVTWVPAKHDRHADINFGYWLMFYDFRNSTIVIPVK